MYPSAEARPGPGQVSKINLFARIVDVFKLTLLTILVKSTIMNVWKAHLWPFLTLAINQMFSNSWVDKADT